jgi:hypothetical protein
VPKATYDALRAVALATGEDVDEHVLQALLGYLSVEGHWTAVDGFGERARARHRTALDRLADP